MEKSKSNWWDLQDEKYLERFLRDPKEGLDHPSRKASRALVEHLMEEKREKEVFYLIDIGCGAGVELENYCQIPDAKSKLWYTGFDASAKMIGICQRRFLEDPRRWPCRSMGFIELPADDVQYGDGTQDLVVIRHLLEHLEDGYEAVMDEALRVSKNLVLVIFFEPLTEDAEDAMVSPVQTGTVAAKAPLNKYSRERWLKYVGDRPHGGFICGEGYYENQVFLIGKDPETPVFSLLRAMGMEEL